jgi:Dyp-type peroxidase family
MGHILLRMIGDVRAVRLWITDFATERVTSAEASRQQTLTWRALGGPGEPFAMFLLAPDGYRYLGFADEQLPAPRDQFNPAWGREYFLRGMKGQSTITQRRYNDPDVSEWEASYQQQIHAMVLLADDDRERLDQSVADVVASVAKIFDVLTIERGAVLADSFLHGKSVIEHFGFRDGISQPIVIQQDLDDEISRRGNKHWDPGAPLSLVLLQEPGPGGGYGSFMVFRKLEQNVKGFWDALNSLSCQSGIAIDDLGAMAVGRFRDGVPAVPTSTVDPAADPNDFHYDQDIVGGRCPFHAHIRKTNPRGDIPRVIGAPAEFERARRIIRRGITYGTRPDLEECSTHEKPTEGVGLLFMCFQSNLDQFAIQQEGADSNDFVSNGVGVDAVIGQNLAPIDQTWPSNGTVKFTMANFVRMLGGEYFFAPSMAFLTGLAKA